MKTKLLILCLGAYLCLHIPTTLFGYGSAFMMWQGGVEGPAGEDSSFQSCTSDTGNLYNSQYNWYYFSSYFTANKTTTITSVALDMVKIGTSSETIVVEIMDDVAGDWDGVVGSTSASVSHGDLPTSEGTWVTFTGVDAPVTSGTTYHIRTYISGYTGSSSNAFAIYRDTGCGVQDISRSDSSSTINSSATTDAAWRFKLYE